MLDTPHVFSSERLKRAIREVPDFPKPGIRFQDITPVLQDGKLFHSVILEMLERVKSLAIDRVVAIESRGFLFGAVLAFALQRGVSLVRKQRKLPYLTEKIEYALEYGNDILEIHVDAVSRGDRVLIVDDVLATGGTAAATARLVEKMGANVQMLIFLLELSQLHGKRRISHYPTTALLSV